MVGEVTYFVGERLGATSEARFLAAIAQGEFLVEHPTQPDFARMAELVWQYRDWPLGAVDASIVALAERLGITTIATLDRRHFGAVQPRHVSSFELVP